MRRIAALTLVLATALPAAARVPIMIYVPGKAALSSGVTEGNEAVVATHPIFESPTYVAAGTAITVMRNPKPRDGVVMADRFSSICLDSGFDQDKFDAAAAAAPDLGLVRKATQLEPMRKTEPVATVVEWQSSSVRATLWPTSLDMLKGRGGYTRGRLGAITGDFRPSKATLAECSVLYDVTGFSDPTSMIAALTARLGLPPAKLVTKPKWADGHWLVSNQGKPDTRVIFSVFNMDEVGQTIYIAALKVTPAVQSR